MPLHPLLLKEQGHGGGRSDCPSVTRSVHRSGTSPASRIEGHPRPRTGKRPYLRTHLNPSPDAPPACGLPATATAAQPRSTSTHLPAATAQAGPFTARLVREAQGRRQCSGRSSAPLALAGVCGAAPPRCSARPKAELRQETSATRPPTGNPRRPRARVSRVAPFPPRAAKRAGGMGGRRYTGRAASRTALPAGPLRAPAPIPPRGLRAPPPGPPPPQAASTSHSTSRRRSR